MWNKKQKIWIIAGIMTLLVAILVLTAGFLYMNHTYTDIRIVDSTEKSGSDQNHYAEFARGILQYSRDGIGMYDNDGDELWNHPCQMQSPTAEICENTAVIGDLDGTSVIVLTRDGVKGEFQTSRPIECLTVSAQGIVGAVLKSEMTPLICCYDAKGNILAEQKASLSNTGYPLGIALAPDGKTLLVSYLLTNETTVSSRVVFYSFADDSEEHVIAEETYADTMIPTVAFLDGTSSMLVGDNKLIVWKGISAPKEESCTEISGEIQKVTYHGGKIAMTLKNKDSSGYRLCVYNDRARLLFSKSFKQEYNQLKLSHNQIILYEGSRCMIYNIHGTKKYEGDIGESISDLVPISGWNKYILLSTEGIRKIRFVD